MTKEETVKIMAMLGAFYSGGKNDPKVQAQAWHLILGKYPYRLAEQAVLHFAENDDREYATFPTVGAIVREMREMQNRIDRPIKEIIMGIHYGRDYRLLSSQAQTIVNDEMYNEWLNMDAEEFSYKCDAFADILKNKQQLLLESKYVKD